MSAIVIPDKAIDVICQHSRDGQIIPLRIRIQDEDGVFQTFVIKSYKDCSFHSTSYTMPNSINVAHQQTWIFDCKIQVIDSLKQIRLIYNTYDGTWKLAK